MDAETWEEEFNDEIEERGVPGHWVLYEDESLGTQEKGARYTQRTFARFQCSKCTRWWNSAEVHVLFFMTLNRALKQGTVKMRIFRQECKKCNFPKLEKPKISLENITRITKNLVNRILQVFYGQKNAKQDLKPEVYSNDMDGPHDKEHCEACKLRICKWQVVATNKQPVVGGYSTQKEPAQKSKSKQHQSDGKTSSYAFTSTATYPNYETDFRSTATSASSKAGIQPSTTYTDYRSTSNYPKYNSERYTTYSPPSKSEEPTFPIVASIIAGIGALALWYLKK
ncbi:receptor-transporting protein 3-like [Anomaloglossus baeobatrachus]|uniref:receptor-transporting protein 3-like n=1 Tax=Anomaloglossus baeobatrachus TaxID=238106 RepID=UPI003F50AEFF